MRIRSICLFGNPVVEDRVWWRDAAVEMAAGVALKRGDAVYWRDGARRYAARVVAVAARDTGAPFRPAVARLYLKRGDEVLAFSDEIELVAGVKA